MQQKEYRYVGKSLSNDNAYGKVTGAVQYCGDMMAPGMLHIKNKAGEIAHGRVIGADTSGAWKVPGAGSGESGGQCRISSYI